MWHSQNKKFAEIYLYLWGKKYYRWLGFLGFGSSNNLELNNFSFCTRLMEQWASQVAQWLKKKKKIHLPVQKAQEIWVQSLSPIPGSGRSPGVGNGSPFQCSCMVNSMDRSTCQARVHGVIKNRAWLDTHACKYNIIYF